MNTHDIELPQGYAERPFDYSGDLYTEGQMRAAIEADRQRRCEPVGWPKVNGVGRVIGSEQSLEIYFDSEPSDDQLRAVHDVLAPTQPAEPVKHGEVK